MLDDVGRAHQAAGGGVARVEPGAHRHRRGQHLASLPRNARCRLQGGMARAMPQASTKRSGGAPSARSAATAPTRWAWAAVWPRNGPRVAAAVTRPALRRRDHAARVASRRGEVGLVGDRHVDGGVRHLPGVDGVVEVEGDGEGGQGVRRLLRVAWSGAPKASTTLPQLVAQASPGPRRAGMPRGCGRSDDPGRDLVEGQAGGPRGQLLGDGHVSESARRAALRAPAP